MKISPNKPHFLRPILPGFKQGIKIPIRFLKYLKGRNHEHAMLRRGGKKWQVKVNDRRLEEGWEKFAEQHDLQLGDILVFRHEGDMEFEVSIFDSNECQREYEEEQKAQNVEESSQKVESKENIGSSNNSLHHAEAAATNEPLGRSHFVYTIKPYCLKYNILCLPRHFVLANSLAKKKCDLIIRDERQKSWDLRLTTHGSDRVVIEAGWHEFSVANGFKEGDGIMFEVVTDGDKPIWKFHKNSNHIKSSSKSFLHTETATHKPFGHSHFVCTVRPYYLSNNILLIPQQFALANGLFKMKKRDLIVRDERKRSWNVILRSYRKWVCIRNGWNKIRDANCLKKGDRIMFEIVTDGEKPIWQIHSKISEEDASIIEVD
ncbi:B3 domain-containing protein REM10-like [Lycium ferocissimum]|uniref:B3 domain-containing protein REM10-like n=1 Tax=Lycium ferocissimum TaxID=112874 RepID=UPI0028163341|nr:B3 domain-containing protein REM10-like [Lycium ferocissimum]